MSEHNNYLIFLTIFISFMTSLHSTKLCNQLQVTIDSAIAIQSKTFVKIWLFSGDLFFESNKMAIDGKERPIFTENKLSQIHRILKSPIDVSFVFNNRITLQNNKLSLSWSLDMNERYIAESETNITTEYIDGFVSGSDLYLIRNDSNSFKLINNRTNDSFRLEIQQISDDIKIRKNKIDPNIGIDPDVRVFDGRLKNKPITAAFSLRQLGADWLHFFAGRHFSRFLLSEQFETFLVVEDITDWIDCKSKEQEEYEFRTLILIFLALLIGVIFLTIIVLVFLVILRLRKNQKTNDLKDNKSKDSKNSKKFEKKTNTSKESSDNFSHVLANREDPNVPKQNPNQK